MMLSKKIRKELASLDAVSKKDPAVKAFISSISKALAEEEKETSRKRDAARDRLISAVPFCSQSAMLLWNSNHNTIFFNDAFLSLFRLPKELSEENAWSQLLSLLLLPEKFGDKIRSILKQEKSSAKILAETKYGQEIEVTFSRIRNGKGSDGFLWQFQDISEQNKLKRNLHNITQVQHTILNGTNYSIVYTNRKGTIIAANKGVEDLLGYSSAELVGKHSPLLFIDDRFLKQRAQELSGETKAVVDPGFEVLTAIARTGVVDTREWECKTSSGKPLSLLLSVSSIINDEGEIAGYLNVFRDVSDKRRSEEALRASEARYKNIVERSTEIIYKTNIKGIYTYVNPVAEQVTGYTSAELCRMRYLDLVEESYRNDVMRFYKAQIRDKVASTYYEFPIRSRSGKLHWIGQSLQLSTDEKGQPELVALAIDVSRQKEAELHMKASNQQLELFKELINYSTDAMTVTGEDGTIFYLNNEAARRYSVKADAKTLLNIGSLDPAFRSLDLWKKHVLDLKQNSSLTYEATFLNEELGVKFPVEVTEKYIRINDEGYVIATSRDITARKRTENLIRAQEEKYRNIIANMNLGLLEVDLDDNIQYANHGFSAMSGYQAQELIGKNAASLLVPQHKKMVRKKIVQRIKGLADMYEVEVRTGRGEKRWWMISGAPNYNDKGELIGSIGIHLDVTDQKRLSIELEAAIKNAEEASRAKEAFLANMSHEIRTPLNGIIGMIRELGHEELSDKQQKFVRNASMASQHLLSVLNNVLDITKIEAGELSLEEHAFSLADTVQEVKRIMNSAAREKGLFLGISTHEVKDKVYIGDAFRIRQVLLNLIGNSIKFTNTGGVFVECRVLEERGTRHRLSVSVEDTGIGMDKDYQGELFKKFSQEDSSISRKYGGTGLGMAIANELIHLMKGRLEVRSVKNEGTVVEMVIELETGRFEETNVRKKIRNRNLSGMRILLAEDNEFNMAVAHKSLARFGCIVTEARNGEEAVNILKEDPAYDVILMDMQMPVMDGIEATKTIRNTLGLQIPVIALTANAFKTEIEACRAVGMNDYITKPYEEQALIELMSLYHPGAEEEVQEEDNLKTAEEALLYDLTNLTEISGGDQEFVNRMLILFAEQSRSTLGELELAHSGGNYAEIARLAHRIKPSIDNMGIHSLKQTIRELEKTARENPQPQTVSNLLTVVSEVLNKVILQVKNAKA